MTNTTKTIQELNLSDGFLFTKVMDDKEICRKVLGKILGIPIQNCKTIFKPQLTKRRHHAIMEERGWLLCKIVQTDTANPENN